MDAGPDRDRIELRKSVFYPVRTTNAPNTGFNVRDRRFTAESADFGARC